jgi:tetratricopeptide (TPR) repeat protein
MPGLAAAHAFMGNVQLARRNSEAAQAAFERALDIEPDLIDALTGLARVDFANQSPTNAIALIEGRLRQTPDNPELLMLAARVYATAGGLAAAEAPLKHVIEVDPSNLRAYEMLAQVYVHIGKLNEALTGYQELLRLQPKSVSALTMIGIILQVQNKPEEARRQYERVITIDPHAGVAANNLAWMYANSDGNLDVALRLAQSAKAQLPTQPEVDDTIGWIYYRKNLPDLAIPPLRQSTVGDPTNPIPHYHLGLAYAKTGNTQLARASLEKALSLKPDFNGSNDARQLLATLR